MRSAGEPVNEVIRRPRPRELHLAIAHGGARTRKFVLVAFDVFPLDQVRNVEHHLSVLCQPATHVFIKRHEQPVHLKAHGAGARLAFALAGGRLSQIGEVPPAYCVRRQVPVHFAAATTVVHKDFEVHLRLAAQLLDVAQELALIRADRLAEALVVVEDRAKPEREDCGVLETVRDHPGMVDAGFLAESLGWIVFADDDGEVACRVKEDLVAADSVNGFERNRFTMSG